MKNIAALLGPIVSALLSIQPAHAGFPSQTVCTNAGGTIQIDVAQGTVSVLTSKTPIEIVDFSFAELDLVERSLHRSGEEKFGCTARTTELRRIAIRKLDGSPMPDAYNRLARNGSLNDEFICSTTSAWLPAPGQACQ